mmetsp:Transcript_19310/g.56046  ORF Transcript_19310/g.56046 Transcript_19310/m.56046 type:complete len:222 (+) Transcript_19310:657-1322(+)
MLDAHLLRLEGTDGGLHVLERALEDLVRGLLLDGVVRLHRQLEVLGLHVHDNQNWFWAVPPVELVDAEVGWLNLWPGGVPADDALLGVHLLEHCVHVFVEVVVQEPNLGVSGILLERHCEAVRDVEVKVGHLAEQGPDHSFCGALGDPVVVVHHAEQDYGMHDDVSLVLFLLCGLLLVSSGLVVFLFVLFLVVLLAGLLLVVGHEQGRSQMGPAETKQRGP